MGIISNQLQEVRKSGIVGRELGISLAKRKTDLPFLKKAANILLPKPFEFQPKAPLLEFQSKNPPAMEFRVGEGLTPEQQIKAEEVIKKPTERIGTLIKLPFIPKEIVTPKSFIAETVKGFAEIPETVITSLKQAPSIIKSGGKIPPPSIDRQRFDIKSYAEQTKELIDKGVSPVIAALWIGSTAIMDTAIMGGAIRSGAEAIKRNIPLPNQSVQSAMQSMGLKEGFSDMERKKAFRELSHILHPDKKTGSQAAFQQLNNANEILKKASTKKIAPLLRPLRTAAEKLTAPISELGKPITKQPFLGVKGLLPMEAGTIPTEPLAPAKMRFGLKGLEIQEFPAKKIPSKGEFKPKEAPRGVLPAKTSTTAEQSVKPFAGYEDLTTKFLNYAKGKQTLSRQEIIDFARRPELKKGEADLLLKKLEEFNNEVVDIPLNKIGGLEPKPAPFPTKIKKITEPIEVVLTDQGDFILEAGNHRYHQAVFNGDKTIPAKIRLEPNAKLPAQEFADSLKQKAIIKKPEKTIPFSRLTEIANKIKNKEATEKSFEEMRTLLAFSDDVLHNNPARQLSKYANKNQELPEVTGQGTSKFARRGDDISSELGFEDSEQARIAYERYVEDRKRVDEIRDSVRELRKNIIDIKKGEKLIRKSVAERRIRIHAAQRRYMLTDREIAKIRQGRDIRAMTKEEFNKYIAEIEKRGASELERSEALVQVKGTIYEKELGNWEALREAMKLPKLSEMNVSQLREFDEALQPFTKGDIFLSKRILETIDRTELAGVRTWQEVRKILAEKLNTTVDKLNNIRIDEFDRLRGQSALSEKDPFFEMVIQETNKVRLIREAEYLEIEKKTFELAKKIKTTFLQKLIPQQKNISKWFKASDKSAVKITPEEEELIKFMQAELIKSRDYLIKTEAMQRGIQSDRYYPHIRRGILEAVKEDGIIQAMKEIFNQYKLDEQAFGIIDRETGDILAMDKFFGNALHRTGELIPTENIVNAFLTYQKTFKKKQALDEITPLIVTYAQALTPKGLTKTGLLLHGNLLRFVKEWLNTQRGRRITLLAKQGGKIDWALRSAKAFTTLFDLGGNVVVTVASQIGEQAIQYKLLGKVNFIKAQMRALTPRGSRIAAKYRNIIGKNPWTEIIEPMKELGDRLNEGIFLLFRDANIRRNKNILLGSMTKEEWANETLSPERLAALKIYISRYGVVDDMGSIVGATPEAGIAKQYKTWALPIIGSEIRNLIYMAKYFRTLGKSEQLKGKRAFIETMRSAELALIVLIAGSLLIDKDDDSFIGKLKQRAYQEAFTLYGALDIRSLTDFRVRQFADDIAKSIISIIKLEKYEESRFGEFEKGELKGVRRLEKQFTPRIIKQFQSVPEKTQKNIRQQIIKEIEDGKISVEAAKERFFNELKKLERANKSKRFKLPEKEYRKNLLERIENKEISVDEAKEEVGDYLDENKEKIIQDTERSEKGIIDMIVLYSRALGTDPITAFNRIFTGQRIRKIEGGAIIVERMPLEESQAIKRERGATEELILDHTIPLQLGGSNSEKNLKLVPVDVWEKYTPVENYLGDKLMAGLIDRKEAKKLIQQFKNGEITEKDIIK